MFRQEVPEPYNSDAYSEGTMTTPSADEDGGTPVTDPMAIMRELSGKPASSGFQPKHKRQRDRGSRGHQQPARSKQPRASERASMAAQVWYDRGESLGFTFPYDVNYFALALQRKVEHDPRMQPFLTRGEFEKVERWLAKMITNWWDHYADGTITASNAKEFFLGNDWEDVRDWAHTNLRKDYLLKHGKRVDPPLYPNQKDYQQRLENIHKASQVQRYLEGHPEEGGREGLDPEGRSRLRSFANRRRRKK